MEIQQLEIKPREKLTSRVIGHKGRPQPPLKTLTGRLFTLTIGFGCHMKDMLKDILCVLKRFENRCEKLSIILYNAVCLIIDFIKLWGLNIRINVLNDPPVNALSNIYIDRLKPNLWNKVWYGLKGYCHIWCMRSNDGSSSHQLWPGCLTHLHTVTGEPHHPIQQCNIIPVACYFSFLIASKFSA